VLVNLLLNAMDAMHDCQGERVIDIIAERHGERQAEVRVSDRGCGFGGNLGRVFESFYSTKQHGMGLGLSISQAIIEAHGGQAWARDDAAGGATVGFQLPLVAA
jgi:C4-dicarboxylate-specific signal transduction histidine kinase